MSFKLELGDAWNTAPKCYQNFAEANWEGSLSRTEINKLLEPYRATIHDNPAADMTFFIFEEESDYLMFLMRWG